MSDRPTSFRGARSFRGPRRGSRSRGARTTRFEAEEKTEVQELKEVKPEVEQQPPRLKPHLMKKREEKKLPDLTPKAQSAVSSEEKNDPLINSLIIVPGISGFIERVQSRKFQLDFTQYLELLETSYDAQQSFDRGIRKYLSFSQFQYYCVILLSKSLWSILSSRGIYTLEYQRLDSLLSFDLPVPDDVNLYLMGVGDISDSNAREFELELQAELNHVDEWFGAQGSFGIVDVDNHIMYETLPSPLVSLLKIQADLQFTASLRNPAMQQEWEQLDWDLPQGLRPLNHHFTLANGTRYSFIYKASVG